MAETNAQDANLHNIEQSEIDDTIKNLSQQDADTPKSAVRKRTSSEFDTVGTPIARKKLNAEDDDMKRLKKELDNKKEILRRLRMVKTYREKKEMQDLDAVAQKWLDASQEALEELHKVVSDSGRCCSMKEMIVGLGVDPAMVRWDEESETFT